jgi:hypothetical protein
MAGYSAPAASLNAGFTPSDKAANGEFVRVTAYDDTPGSWTVRSPLLNGCTAAPYNYTPSMLLNWAAPWVTFRSDDMALEFKWLSVREIGPLSGP